MLKKTRRVISGIDGDKKSVIIADEHIEMLAPYPSLPSFYYKIFFIQKKILNPYLHCPWITNTVFNCQQEPSEF